MDILFEQMKKAVTAHYDKYFPPGSSYKKDHLDALHRMYSFERFDTCDDLEKERIAFLTEVHESVWGA